uniref:Cyclic nucleotide-binding domain-containing protein n=1 Tax=Neobodo designis TaxID=312471 RepID=A0A7S1M9S8_NEODS|mmetsp:Transcript_36769/g.113413  ORF Transcript_36769/g.113413 Transcript_36769/m.113413 type:complete len:724 (+) Transcript_36769:256-2427(+)
MAEETNGKAVVSEMEIHNIRRIFNRFDADGSGTIDVDELKDVMTSLGVEMDDHHLRELVEQVTSSGEQELGFDEFVSLITLWKEASQYKLFDGKGFKSLAQQHVEDALETKCFVPDKPWRAAWDVAVCLAALAYWIWVLLLDAYTHELFNTAGLITGDVLLTLIFVGDALLSSRTCFTRDIRLVDEPEEVFQQYLRTWLVPDVLASLPLDLICTGAGAPTAGLVLRHLRLLKLCKIPFLWRSSGSVPITSRYIQFHFHMLPIFQLVLTFVIMVHGFSIGWVLLKQRNCDDVIAQPDCRYSYTSAVYFVLYTLSTVGLGDIAVVGDAEQWYASFVLCGAMATNGIVIGKLVAILQRADINKERRAKLRETLAVLDHFAIPRQLQEEILQFQAHVLEHNLGAAYEGIVSGLPAEMRTNISLFVKMKLVTNVPLFNDSHYMLRIAVAQSLENAVARPEQYVIVHGQASDGLYFLAYGFADVFQSDGAYDGTLRSGDYFGDGALLGEKTQPISVKAITYCDLWILSQAVFGNILKRFPKFHRHVEDLRHHNPLKSPPKGDGASNKEDSTASDPDAKDSRRSSHVTVDVAKKPRRDSERTSTPPATTAWQPIAPGDGQGDQDIEEPKEQGASPASAPPPVVTTPPPPVATVAPAGDSRQRRRSSTSTSRSAPSHPATRVNERAGMIPPAALTSRQRVSQLRDLLSLVKTNKQKLQRAADSKRSSAADQ